MSFKDKFFKNSPLESHGAPHDTKDIKKEIKTSTNRLDSLNQVVSTYEKALANRASMENAIKNFKKEGIDPKRVKEEADTFLKNDSDPDNQTMFTFIGKDKKEIGATGGDFASSDKYWFKTKYFERPVEPTSAIEELKKEKDQVQKLQSNYQASISKLPRDWEKRALNAINKLGYKKGSLEYKEYMKAAKARAQAAGNV